MDATRTEPRCTIERLLTQTRQACGVAAVVLYWRVETSGNLLPICVESSSSADSVERYITAGKYFDVTGQPIRPENGSTAGAPLAAAPIVHDGSCIGVVAAYGASSTADCAAHLRSCADRFAAIADELRIYCGVRARRTTFELGALGVQRTARGGRIEDLLMRHEAVAFVVLGTSALAVSTLQDGKPTIAVAYRTDGKRQVVVRDLDHPISVLADNGRALSVFPTEAGVVDALALPLVPGHESGGLFILGWPAIRPKGREVDAAIGSIARHLAPAIAIGRLRRALSGHHKRVLGARRRIGLMSRVARELGSSLDEESLLRNATKLLVPDVCDYCLLHVARTTKEVRLASSTGNDADILASLRKHFADRAPSTVSDDGTPAVFVSRRQEVITDVAAAVSESILPPDNLLALLSAGAHSSVSVPIFLGEKPSAILTLIFTNSEVDSTDTDLIHQIASRIELSLANSRQYAREYRISHMLQRALLPHVPEEIHGMSVSAAYASANHDEDIGGDWYDVFPLSNERFGISVGDVAGHGIDATSIMNVTRHAIRVAALAEPSPAAVLARVDRMLQMEAKTPLVTAIYGVMHARFRRFEFSIAGHPPPMIARADGSVRSLDCSGPALGIGYETNFTLDRVDLELGDSLMLYSDGMIEYGRDVLEGERRLREALQQTIIARGHDPANFIQNTIFGGSVPRDDAIVLVIRCDLQDQVRVDLSAVPQSCRTARVLIRKFLSDHGIDESRASDILLAAGEAVTNAVEHAYADGEPRDFSLSLDAEDGRVSVVIRDAGRWREGSRVDRGRGIALMRATMDDVKIDTTIAGTEVRLIKNKTLEPV